MTWLTWFRRNRPVIVPAHALDAQLAAAQQRTYAAEDATRAMADSYRAMRTRLDAALRQAKLNAGDRDQALGAKASLERRVRELGQEVVALRHLLERAQVPRGADRRCPQCQEPMQFGMSHYCPKTSTYNDEGVAA